MDRKPRVAFICTHNSCRSQIAEALGKWYGKDVIDTYSAGTEIADQINPKAVAAMQEVYEVDMTQDQYPKTLDDIPAVDIAVSMGCGVQCPVSLATFYEDWGIEDPTGKDDEAYLDTIYLLEEKVKYLIDQIIQGHYAFEELDEDPTAIYDEDMAWDEKASGDPIESEELEYESDVSEERLDQEH